MLINYDTLRELVGVETYDQVKYYHKGWVEEYLGDGNTGRGIPAKESNAFVERVKSALGALAKGRNSMDAGEGYQLREPSAPFGDYFGVKNEDIGPQNTYY